MLKKIIKTLKKPRRVVQIIIQSPIGRILPDETYIKILYWSRLGKKLNLNDPVSYNEKIQWLKLYDHNNLYPILVDKLEVKEYISDKYGKDLVIPTIQVWESFDDINFGTLPSQFVLKCTHDSGGVVIFNKNITDEKVKLAAKKLRASLNTNYYWACREWPYKDVKPRIIAEEMIGSDGNIRDYKFFCNYGKVIFYKVDFDRFTYHRANYYSRDGIQLPFGEAEYPPDYNRVLEMPDNIGEMITLAEEISKDFPFIRVDLYNVQGKIYFGELTLYPASGLGIITSDEWDIKAGEMIDIQRLIDKRRREQ